MATVYFPFPLDKLTGGQLSTITKTFLMHDLDCCVYPEDDAGEGWVYVEVGPPTAEARGDGHYLDTDGDYRLAAGKVKFEDL